MDLEFLKLDPSILNKNERLFYIHVKKLRYMFQFVNKNKCPWTFLYYIMRVFIFSWTFGDTLDTMSDYENHKIDLFTN